MDNNLISKYPYDHLIREAKTLGASDAVVISSGKILVKDELAGLCNAEYTCPNYGLAASCPPHVKGPFQFRTWQAHSQYAIVVKIELPTSIMFSDERKEVMQLLHQMVAAIELKAVESGLENSRAFAGGSCKDLFCHDQETCCVITENNPCRHMESARPSMSGFGIDVTRLMMSCGWSGQKAKESNITDTESTTWVAGLVLLG